MPAVMTIPVKIYEVIDAFEMLGDENRAYLNKTTGEVFVVDDQFSGIEDEESGPEWQRELMVKIREIEDEDDWLPLPGKFEIHDWDIMDEFCRSVNSDQKRKLLMSAIRGSKAFRRFRETISDFGMTDQWYRFRGAALERIAIDWLEENRIPYTKESRPEEGSRQ
jgi:hypothetical protein